MGLWESPIYRFRVPVNEESSIDLKEIVVDVTGSASPFKEPSENLKEVLEDVFSAETALARVEMTSEVASES
jgi:hypothetical protein